ncbi:uncharacterized protein LOC131292812 [Anopheles ziemanni]|uniref:uncharacterized protein LOC131271161 n=1 Tax=Anopheles coustani TaxID=139045 RepID=UPI002657E62B|nr:uncharacterized protein LOC131271161 [Anopheles coustani]XP_058176878.1 uncharacterized protein LOC131292812 [Anopheles ziemanni]
MADSRSTPASFTFHHTPRAQSGHATAGPSQADGHPEGLTPLTHPTHSDRTIEPSPHTRHGTGSKVDPIAEKRRQIELASRELEWQIRELTIQEERRAYEQERNTTVNDATSASTTEMRKAEEWLDSTDRCGETQPARGVGFLGENPAERSLFFPEYASRSGFSEWRRKMEASAAVNRHSAWTGPTMATQGHQPESGGRHCDNGAMPKAPGHNTSLHYAEGTSPRGFPAPNVNLSGACCNTTILNQSQLAARQSTSKDLPTFSGSAAEWPLFIARYELSSTLCGFSDDENLLRLQKALTGAARKAVEHLLLLPSGLKDAINILRTRFGRPELIVESLVERVRRMPAPRNDRLDTLAEFGFEVQNLCATIRATGMYGYMCDVTLLRELTAKLPDTTFIEWARHRRDLPNVSLFEFVTLHGPNGSIKTFAFFDDGSTSTFVEHGLVQELGLQGTPHPLCLKWTGTTTREEKESVQVALRISSRHESGTVYELPVVHSMKKLALPEQSLCTEQLLAMYTHLRGLPIESYKNVTPRVLIGIDNCRLGQPIKTREGKKDEPTAAKTRLGWVVYGPCDKTIAARRGGMASFHICTCNGASDDALDSAFRQFFTLESMGILPSAGPLRSKDDEKALAILAEKTKLQGARYETGLLWKNDDVKMPPNKAMAMRRYECLKRKMIKDPKLANAIREKMRDYEAKGYIRRLRDDELTERRPRDWFLPVFPVVNVNKPGKMRMVFDAAAEVNGISLNKQLLTGPDQIANLLSVLYRFREYRVAIVGDIREMFFQVQMRPEDQRSQMILWRDDDDVTNPDVYVVTVMTFGAACSPSSAHYVKNINAERFAEKYPRAAFCIKEEHYVDDMLASVETEAEAQTLAEEVRYIHAQGGFEIRNFLSNSKKVVHYLQGLTETEADVCVTDAVTEKVLGMWWNTTSDSFSFKLSPKHNQELLTGTRMPSKREVLSTLMSVYDPMGLIGNFLMFLKILLQETFRAKLEWDQKIEGRLTENWVVWISALPEVEKVCVPRCYRQMTSTEAVIQLHIFCDASENGMAAVAYFRFEERGVIECALVGSKTRVASLKYASIPRLELQAALIGARLACCIAESHRTITAHNYFWTDSRDVTCWLQSDHRRYSQFVAFRVGEITEKTNIRDWQWLSTKLNVADEATKRAKIPDLSPTSRWFRGPEFLWSPESSWPVQREEPGETEEEIRKHVMHHSVEPPLIEFTRFSRWTRLLRAAGYVVRFISNTRSFKGVKTKATGPLSYDELRNAEAILLQQIQAAEFSDEIRKLKGAKKAHPWQQVIAKSSSLYKLSPAFNDQGVLVLRGRLPQSPWFDETMSSPVILPRGHYGTDLLIRDFHERLKHGNHQTAINEIRAKYYIPRLMTEYKRVLKSCQHCKNRDAKPVAPVMGSIPKERLAISQQPFTYTGLDYFGPMYVTVGRHEEKRWGVIFTCLTTRAVHLEVARSLTADSCILAIRRFMTRRGAPREFISDQGTNFIGASRELAEIVKELSGGVMMAHFNGPDLKWTFNPPAAPHFGGCWERLVRSVKKVINEFDLPRRPTDEVLETTLKEIELILNSRPLTYVPLEDEFEAPITPNHILLGSSNGTKPLVPFDDSPTAVRSSWKATERNANMFWKKWVGEYLPTLTRRTKWFQPVEPLQPGDVVLIADNNLPRNCWPKGRVTEVVKAKDGQVRRATVKTKNGTLERPVTKLAKLDVLPRNYLAGPQDDVPEDIVDDSTLNLDSEVD